MGRKADHIRCPNCGRAVLVPEADTDATAIMRGRQHLIKARMVLAHPDTGEVQAVCPGCREVIPLGIQVSRVGDL